MSDSLSRLRREVEQLRAENERLARERREVDAAFFRYRQADWPDAKIDPTRQLYEA